MDSWFVDCRGKRQNYNEHTQRGGLIVEVKKVHIFIFLVICVVLIGILCFCWGKRVQYYREGLDTVRANLQSTRDQLHKAEGTLEELRNTNKRITESSKAGQAELERSNTRVVQLQRENEEYRKRLSVLSGTNKQLETTNESSGELIREGKQIVRGIRKNGRSKN
jgi:cell shape-determining protein MreC